MKSILLAALLFVASASAACNCKPTEQACIDTCVMTANNCIAKCDKDGSKGCREGCISASWPSSILLPEQKDVLAAPSGSNGTASRAPSSSGIPVATGNSTIAPKPTASTVSPKTNVDDKSTSSASYKAYSAYILATSVVAGSLVLFA